MSEPKAKCLLKERKVENLNIDIRFRGNFCSDREYGRDNVDERRSSMDILDLDT